MKWPFWLLRLLLCTAVGNWAPQTNTLGLPGTYLGDCCIYICNFQSEVPTQWKSTLSEEPLQGTDRKFKWMQLITVSTVFGLPLAAWNGICLPKPFNQTLKLGILRSEEQRFLFLISSLTTPFSFPNLWLLLQSAARSLWTFKEPWSKEGLQTYKKKKKNQLLYGDLFFQALYECLQR